MKWCGFALLAWIILDSWGSLRSYPLVLAWLNVFFLIIVLPFALFLAAAVALTKHDYKTANLCMIPAVPLVELMALIPGNPFGLGLCEFLLFQASTLIQMERSAPAEKIARRVLALNQGPPVKDIGRQSFALVVLASAQCQSGRYAESEATTNEAIKVMESHKDGNPALVAASLADFCVTLSRQGKAKQALEMGKRALEMMENIGDPDKDKMVTLGMTLNNVAVAYDDIGQGKRAEELYQRSLKIKLKVFGEKSEQAVLGYDNLACALIEQKDYDRALEPVERAKQLATELDLGKRRIWANILTNCGDVYRAKGRLDEAEKEMLEGLRLRERNKSPELDHTYLCLGKLYSDKGDFAKAKSFFDKALTLREKRFGSEHPKVASTLEEYAKLQVKLGFDQEAQQMEERAKSIREKFKDLD
jgi:tetratricopeptide (TPR) repeat protein